MSLKESDSVPSLFFLGFRGWAGHPNIIYEEPDDEASSSDKDVSDATLPAIKTLSIYLFFGGFGQEGQKRDSISQKQIPPPHAPTVRLPRNRKEGPGARASWVGV